MRLRELERCSDEQLVQLYSQGEMAAFEVVLARYKRPLFQFILRFVTDRTRAEDLLQETFLRMIEHVSSFEGSASLRTWTYRIARNLCIDEGRRMKHRRHPSLDAPASVQHAEDGQNLHDKLPDRGANPERETGDHALSVRISAAIDELPTDQREVFVLRQVQNLSFKEIGDITGVSENTVKSRMRYALERLQRALADYQEHVEELR